MTAPRSRSRDEHDIVSAFGNGIRRRRSELGMTQEELADKARIHRTYIGDVERGARNIALRNIQKLADALDIGIAELFVSYCAPIRRRSARRG